MRRSLVALVVSVLLAVSPALGNPSPTDLTALDEGSDHTPQIPDPATRVCIALGGIARSVDLDIWGGAPIGLCRLHDDALVADWTLFGGAFGAGNQAVEAFLAGQWTPTSEPIETWADQACVDAGGQIVEYVEHLRPDSIVRLCEFPDLSFIEAWTLFAGPDLYPELGRVLHWPGIPGGGIGASPLSVSAGSFRAVGPAAGRPGFSGAPFQPCPGPRTCMAPCLQDAEPQVLCRGRDGRIEATTYACCCCGSSAGKAYAPLP